MFFRIKSTRGLELTKKNRELFWILEVLGGSLRKNPSLSQEFTRDCILEVLGGVSAFPPRIYSGLSSGSLGGRFSIKNPLQEFILDGILEV